MKNNTDNTCKNVQTIHIKRISVDPGHIRKSISDINGLKNTIADAGLLQPILVRQTDNGYTVVDGARRLRALKELDVPELIIGKDIIVDSEETAADTKFKQLIANVQREDINDIELGHALVDLKEKYGYAYKEIAEIIGKTPHYVAAKVGLSKRLTLEVQELVIKDWEASKCIRSTCKGEDDAESPYVMNVNIIEDIARLPGELQKAAYENVKEKEMDKKEALRYLRSIKEDAEILKMADDARGLMEAYSQENGNKQIYSGKEISRYIKKIDRDMEKLSTSIKSGAVNKEEVMPALEALIERLSLLYIEIKSGKNVSKAVI